MYMGIPIHEEHLEDGHFSVDVNSLLQVSGCTNGSWWSLMLVSWNRHKCMTLHLLNQIKLHLPFSITVSRSSWRALEWESEDTPVYSTFSSQSCTNSLGVDDHWCWFHGTDINAWPCIYSIRLNCICLSVSLCQDHLEELWNERVKILLYIAHLAANHVQTVLVLMMIDGLNHWKMI